MKLSDDQLKIVNMRDKNILVSAAAGSGKTRVLVERIMSRLRDKEDPIDIDRILVLTFTRAAAGEMRERIALAISRELEERETDEHMLKQATLVHNAQITTIDSFCLDILRNNFTEIGLEPGFRTANEEEVATLAEEAMDEVLEEVLSGGEIEHLDEFLDRFECKDSIRKIKESILAVYKEANNAPFVEDYIEMRREDYNVADVASLKTSPWFLCMWTNVKETLASALDKIYALRRFCEENGPEEYIPICESDFELVSMLDKAQDLEELIGILREGVSFATLPRKTTCEAEIKEHAKSMRDLYKDLIKGITTRYADTSLDLLAQRMQSLNRSVGALLDIVLRYHLCLEDKKRQKGIVTFSDMEHMALKILLHKEGDRYVPSMVARDYRKVFKELMIDEYQDSNYTQEWLIHSISGEDEGIYDRFMVGDVKQSIYRFRNANPDLFVEKYDEYEKNGGDLKIKIDLSANYRSRKEVLETVNTVFERTFDRQLGGVDYDKRQRLYYGGLYDNIDGDDPDSYRSELMLLEVNPGDGISRETMETRMLADRIRHLIKEQMIFDKDTESLRPCRYSDIVILLRSMSYNIDDMRREFEAQGIPVHTASKGGYFDTPEITSILNYLSILDNPGNDIVFYGVLDSVFGGFDEKDAVCLKVLDKSSLYETLKYLALTDRDDIEDNNDKETVLRFFEACGYAQGGFDGLKGRCTDFYKRLSAYRDMVPYTPVYRLLRLIYSDHSYVDHVASLPGGEQKKANVLALLSKAEAYEHDGFRGIFDFNRYTERIHKYESEEGEVMTLSENADVIRIMTMHKSKGLEYPICILAGLNRKFNLKDSSEEIIFHSRYGMGLDFVDTKKRAKYRDLRKRFIADAINLDSKSEEMRVFYVAMTRAKEKLIMSATLKDIDSEFKRYEGDPTDIAERKKIGSYLDILRLSRGDDDWNGQCILSIIKPEDIEIGQIEDATIAHVKRDGLEEKLTRMSQDDLDIIASIRDRIDFAYPHPELKELYTKTSVSELKMAAIHQMEENIYDVPDELYASARNGENDNFEAADNKDKKRIYATEEEYIPSFIKKEEEQVSGAAVGSAYHRIMELLDFAATTDSFDRDDLDMQMRKHIDSGALLETDYELADKEKIVRFVKSKLGRRMQKAAESGLLCREKPFVMGIAANRLNDRFPEEEMVLIQGIIDAFFTEEGNIILLDYKTDTIKNEKQLTDRYKTQLDYYEEALARITGMPVSERLLYSFCLETVIRG